MASLKVTLDDLKSPTTNDEFFYASYVSTTYDHKFMVMTFSTVTTCDHCQKALHGLYHQGLICSGKSCKKVHLILNYCSMFINQNFDSIVCGMICHRHCVVVGLPPCAHTALTASRIQYLNSKGMRSL